MAAPLHYPLPPPLQPHSTPSLIPALWLVHHHHLTPPAPSPLPLSSRVWVPCLILFGFIFWFVSFLFVSQSNSDCDRQGWSVRWLGLSVSLHSVDRCHRFPQRSLRFRHGTGWLIYFFLLWSCLEPDVIVSVWARPFPSTSCFSRKIRSSKTRQVDRRPRVLYFCFFPVSFLLSFFKKKMINSLLSWRLARFARASSWSDDRLFFGFLRVFFSVDTVVVVFFFKSGSNSRSNRNRDRVWVQRPLPSLISRKKNWMLLMRSISDWNETHFWTMPNPFHRAQ